MKPPEDTDQIPTVMLGPPNQVKPSSQIRGRDSDHSQADDPWIGRRIGPYRLESVLGRGGMGAVYAASRADGAYEHQVAVKVVHRSMPGATAALRFRQERQILARLEHPGIARILDGGVTDDRVPYLVLEMVEGDSITEAADRERMSLNERIDLFLEVCRAVEAAHRSLVVHRDLKPANVLVDDERRVKLLDFGIAKLLDDETDDAGIHTRTGFVAMTPAYASPEQILGDAIGTATDVYGLGLIFFELLVGSQAQPVTDVSPTGLFQAICGKQPSEPSRAVEQLVGDEAESLATLRRTTPSRWARDLRGDLDVIVGRCLSKEPERRYGSAGELALDLERYRKGLPVEARPDSLAYRTRKLIGRHRTAFFAAALALTALVVGLVLAVSGMLRARDAEQRMAAEAQAARQTADFMVQLFDVSDPKERTEVPSARVLLDRAAESISGDLDRAPEVRAQLLGTLGRVYANLGAFDRAESMRVQQLSALDQADPDPEAEALARVGLADAVLRLGKFDEAFSEAELAIEILESAGLMDTLAGGRAYRSLGIATWMRSDYISAHEQLLRAMNLLEAHQDPDPLWRMKILNNLAILEVELGQIDSARARYETALDELVETWGDDDVRLAPTLNNLALLENGAGNGDAAEAYHRRALTIRERELGSDHPDVAETLNNLGDALANQGRWDESRELLERARDIRFEVLGPEHPASLTTRFNLARNSRNAGQLEEARTALEKMLPEFVVVFGSEHSYTSYVLLELAQIDLKEGMLEQARERAQEALAIRTASYGPEHPATQDAQALIHDIDEADGASADATTAGR